MFDDSLYFVLVLALDDAGNHHGLVEGEAEPGQVGHEEHGHGAYEDGGRGSADTSIFPRRLNVGQHSVDFGFEGASKSLSTLLKLLPDDHIETGEEDEGGHRGGGDPGPGGVPEDVILAEPQLGRSGVQYLDHGLFSCE